MVESITPSNTNPTTGELINVQVKVKNVGDADAGSFRISWNESGASVLCSSPHRTVFGLAAGQSRTVSLWGISYSTAGTKTLTAEADPCSDVDENNTANNDDSITLYVEEPCLDSDNDGICDSDDNCPGTYNKSQLDSDGDGVGDSCEVITSGGSSGGGSGVLCGVATPLTLTATLAGMFGIGTSARRRRCQLRLSP